ncbi:MAG: trans-sulfuration enzyme family protein [Candidatus Hodarchaeota archaeon]
MEKKKYKFLRGFATRAIHSTLPKEEDSRPITPPIYQTTSFDVKDAFIKQISPKYIYTRGGNPTLHELEVKLANLENGDVGETFASGMGAISTTVLSIANKGDEIIADYELYGGTQGLFNNILSGCGIKVNYIDMTNYDAILETINDRTKLIYVETPANPTLKITDLEELSKIAKEKEITTVADNTFNSPYNLRPLEYGINFVVHSLTKFIGGHGDALGGATLSKRSDFKLMNEIKKNAHGMGACLSPFNAFLFLRGLKTLELRMNRHNYNATELAKALEERTDKIEKVIYPGLPSHPQHKLAKKQMDGFGCIVTFYLKKGNNVQKFLRNLEIPHYTVSLGDADTLIEDPFNLTHFSVSYKVKKMIGITKYMIRVSVGLENVEDLIDDFNNSLDLL